MFSIEQRGREWLVIQAGEMISVHPTRAEAERAIEWLANNHATPSTHSATDIQPDTDPHA